MKKLKNFLVKHMATIAALALFVGVSTMNSACLHAFHQPKIPQAMDSYRM